MIEERVINKDIWIQNNVAGLSFADIGGLWGTVNEKLTVAVKAGAKEATMIDIVPQKSELWHLFHERCRSIGVADYRYFTGDICEVNAVRNLGNYDFVHCSGIIYHVGDLFNFLKNLYQIANRYLIITSMIVPDVVENSLGKVEFKEGKCCFIPLLSGKTKEILAAHFTSLGVTIKGINGSIPKFILPSLDCNTGPWWWLFSPSTLKGMIELFPGKIIDEGYSWKERSYSLLIKRE